MNTTGFPSPAQGYEEKTFDFNDIIVKHPAATFTMRYNGSDLKRFNIIYGDIIIVDCAIEPRVGKLAIIKTDSKFICRELIDVKRINNKKIFTYIDENNHTYICAEIFGCVSSLVRTY
jgi:DNA polymerase V